MTTKVYSDATRHRERIIVNRFVEVCHDITFCTVRIRTTLRNRIHWFGFQSMVEADDPSSGGTAQSVTPVPWGKVSLIGLVMFANMFSSSLFTPVAPFMVIEFYPDLDEEDIGFYAGWLTSVFQLGQLFGAIIWGRVSDHHGRRPVMLLGLVGTFVFVIGFGFSSTFEAALFCRFLWGFLNGNVGGCQQTLTLTLRHIYQKY